MKRIIAISDAHGDIEAIRAAFVQAQISGPINVAVFLGDGSSGFHEIEPELSAQGIECHAVSGNCDWNEFYPSEALFAVDNANVYICHGHQWGVKYGLYKLEYAAMEKKAQIALFGHTHEPYIDMSNGIWYLNPGSVSDPYPGKCAYAEIIVKEDGTIVPSLTAWK